MKLTRTAIPMKKILKVSLGFLTATGLMASLNGCDALLHQKTAYGNSSEQKTLKLVVVRRPLTYQRLHQLESGFEFEILQHFALDMGYRLKIKQVKNEKILIQEMEQGNHDIGASRLTQFLVAQSELPRSPVYDEEKISLVCYKNLDFQASSKWHLAINSSRAEMQWLKNIRKISPRLKVSLRENSTSLSILKSMARNKADCTLMDRLEAQYYSKVFPKLKIIKDLSQPYPYFFLLSKSRPELSLQLRHWMTKASHRHVLSQFKMRAKGKPWALSEGDVKKFAKAREAILPQYSSLFKKHSQSFGVPWQLAAAVAYQESKWNPQAESFTGVRGFMQLTQETAEHLGVENRLDPSQSIWGGVKYIKMLIDRQPKGLAFNEQLALALATYNVGPAHMLDAQKLAQRLGKNPYSWKDLKEVLPLLGEETYLPFLKYGPARGHEPVEYVHRVFGYLDLITVQI